MGVKYLDTIRSLPEDQRKKIRTVVVIVLVAILLIIVRLAGGWSVSKKSEGTGADDSLTALSQETEMERQRLGAVFSKLGDIGKWIRNGTESLINDEEIKEKLEEQNK